MMAKTRIIFEVFSDLKDNRAITPTSYYQIPTIRVKGHKVSNK
jgi:hypothetical protein